MAIYSRSPVQKFDNWWFWVRKNTCIAYLIREEDDIEKIYLYAKDLGKLKYEFLIKKREDVGQNYFNDPNAFTDCSNGMTFMRILMITTQTDKETF